jgi:hypothetical protein
MNALVAQGVRACVELGVRYLVYSDFLTGKSRQAASGTVGNRMIFKRVDLSRYYVSLTRLGQFAFLLRLHHRFVESLPAPSLLEPENSEPPGTVARSRMCWTFPK